VVVGNIGSESRAKYGIVGSAVNETDRIQSVAEGGTVVISEQTYKLLEGRIEVGPKLEVNLKGLDASRRLYQVKAIDDKAGSTRD
jgi:class 3 adenylate cyclase